MTLHKIIAENERYKDNKLSAFFFHNEGCVSKKCYSVGSTQVTAVSQ